MEGSGERDLLLEGARGESADAWSGPKFRAFLEADCCARPVGGLPKKQRARRPGLGWWWVSLALSDRSHLLPPGQGENFPCSGRPARMSPATERAPNPARETCLSRRNAQRVRAPGRGLDSRNNAGLTAVNSFCLCRGACLQVILLFGGKRRVRFFPTEIEVGN